MLFRSDSQSRMPVLFVGHGSPMNAIEDNEFSKGWREIAGRLPRPRAILSVSAHWTISGTHVNDELHPRTIHDFYGFPKPLYDVTYQPPGAPGAARAAAHLLSDGPDAITASVDNSWGIDHGTWSVLRWMYPYADIPVFQLSIARRESRQHHLDIGRQLRPLRDQGILILGSGNVVHNLALADWGMAGGFDWADDFDQYIRDSVIDGRFDDVVNFHRAGNSVARAFTTTEHFDPLLYVLGAVDGRDQVAVFNEARIMGSLSMTSYLFETSNR